MMHEASAVIVVAPRHLQGLTGGAANKRKRKASAACAGAKFDFISYMRDSMEEDYARLVGLGLPMWLFLIFFVLLSSVWGAPSQQ